jgi:hypothetical protein
MLPTVRILAASIARPLWIIQVPVDLPDGRARSPASPVLGGEIVLKPVDDPVTVMTPAM